MCDYCEHGEPMYPIVADGEIDHMEIIVENDRMIIELGNEDAVFRVNRCPMCGRELIERNIEFALAPVIRDKNADAAYERGRLDERFQQRFMKEAF